MGTIIIATSIHNPENNMRQTVQATMCSFAQISTYHGAMHESKQTITGDISVKRTGRLNRGSVVRGDVLWRCMVAGGPVHVLPGIAALAFFTSD